jgi:cytochrome P450
VAHPTCPGPPSRFEALTLFRRPFGTLPGYLLDLAQRYGPVTRLRGTLTDLYLLDDPDLIEEVLAGKGRSFEKSRGAKRLRPLLGDGLLTSEEPVHLRHRRLVQPAFNRNRVDAYAPNMVAATERLAASWRDGETVTLDRAMMRLALEIAAETMFGSDVSGETESIGAALDQALSSYPQMIAVLGELNDVLPTRAGVRFRQARRSLRATVERLIARKRGARDGGDFLSLLIAARDERGAFSDDQARDEALTILLAGHETTANALSWTFDLLGRNPEATLRIEDELAAVLGGRAPGVEDLARLPLVRGAISEALRLFPPAWLTGRSATESVQIGAYTLRRGDVALLSPYVTHRNPRLWREPERFMPERWIEDARPERFAFFPFGGGTRACIGESFAWLEATLVVATLLQRVRFELLETSAVPLAPLVTLRPARPIRARVAVRQPEPVAN